MAAEAACTTKAPASCRNSQHSAQKENVERCRSGTCLGTAIALPTIATSDEEFGGFGSGELPTAQDVTNPTEDASVTSLGPPSLSNQHQGIMGLRVNTNVASINAQRNLSSVSSRLGTSYRRLSTGLRISTAADDAAGLAISERLRSQVRSLEQGKRNANDGVSLVQTAEGALNEVSSILIRLRELAIQSSNGSVSNQDKNTLDEEFQSLVNEVNRIGRSTEFNGIKLLDGSSSSVTFQVGLGTTTDIDTLSVTLSAALSTSLSLQSLDIGSGGATTTAITSIDSAINTISGLRGSLGAIQNRLGSTIC